MIATARIIAMVVERREWACRRGLKSYDIGFALGGAALRLPRGLYGLTQS